MNDLIATASQYINTDPFLLFFGTFYFVLGLSILMAKRQWHDFTDLFIKNESLSLVFGFLSLPMSLFIIVFYNDWADLASTILMVLGYVGLVKALLLLLRPGWIQAWLSKEFVHKMLWLDGVSGIVLGLAMLTL